MSARKHYFVFNNKEYKKYWHLKVILTQWLWQKWLPSILSITTVIQLIVIVKFIAFHFYHNNANIKLFTLFADPIPFMDAIDVYYRIMGVIASFPSIYYWMMVNLNFNHVIMMRLKTLYFRSKWLEWSTGWEKAI